MKKSMIYKAVLAAMLVASSSAALAVGEIENNAPIQIGQRVSLDDGSVTINAAVSGPGDVDYFSFEGKKDQKIRIDIDGGVQFDSMGMARGVDTLVALFGPGPAYLKHAENDDGTLPLDDGSVHIGDSFISEFRLTEDGIWTVGVSRRNGIFRDGGGFVPGPKPPLLTAGAYTLIISDLAEREQIVNIDVKPGSPDPSPVNAKAKGVIPIALLGDAKFDVKEVDVASLTFGHTGDEATLRHCQKTFRDVNADGFLDLVCHFENGAAGFREQDLMGFVKGKKANKKAFKGHGRLKVKPVESE